MWSCSRARPGMGTVQAAVVCVRNPLAAPHSGESKAVGDQEQDSVHCDCWYSVSSWTSATGERKAGNAILISKQNKTKTRGITVHDFKLYCKAVTAKKQTWRPVGWNKATCAHWRKETDPGQLRTYCVTKVSSKWIRLSKPGTWKQLSSSPAGFRCDPRITSNKNWPDSRAPAWGREQSRESRDKGLRS